MEDNTLTLNITSYSNVIDRRKDQPNKKQQRILRMKRKRKESDDEDRSVPAQKETQTSQHKNHTKPQPSQRSTNTSSHHIVSSLFRNNPVIPNVERKEVNSIKETVFSTDLFAGLPLHPYMISNLEDKLQLSTLTSVQKQAIPVILNGNDTLIKSQTGSGKTLAYAVPMVEDLQSVKPRISREHGTYAVIIVPTRELAIQSFETLQKLIRPFVWIVPGCIMGGEKMKSEKARIRKGMTILVATPGRLLDHIKNTAALNLVKLKWLIIDEADRLLDMGFERDVSQIIAALNERTLHQGRQTVLLSATLTEGVDRLAGMCLNSPKKIEVTQDTPSKDDVSSNTFVTPENLRHYFTIVPSKLRLVALTAFILWKCKFATSGSKVIVFFSTQDSVQFHFNMFQEVLGEEDLDFFRLHGNMEQKERTKIFKEFTEIKSGVLLCTDVAARGLDLPKVSWIVQYNVPTNTTDYVHRVGRTARAGCKGQALIFLTTSEVEYVSILNQNNISIQEISMNDILKTLLINKKTMKDEQISHAVEEKASQLQRNFENIVKENKQMLNLAKKAYLSYVRAYSTYPANMKHIFHVKRLHIGHAAKSFGLNEAPSKISNAKVYSKMVHKPRVKEFFRDDISRSPKRRKVDLSEYSSGVSHVTDNFKKVTKKRNINKKTKTKKTKSHNN